MISNLDLRPIAPDVYVAPQLQESAFAALAQAGIKSVINNRPDFEGGAEQPSHTALADKAAQAQLQYAYLPVLGSHQTPEQIAACAELLNTLPKPLLMFCRSGARSANLYQQAVQLNNKA